MELQTTLCSSATCMGVGLHTGRTARLRLEPAPADTGIVFIRDDLPGRPEIPCRPPYVADTHLATTLGNGGARVATVEHLLAAAYGLGVDNLRVHIDGPEVPAMDGSSIQFVHLMRAVGLRTLSARRVVLEVVAPVTVEDGLSRAALLPAPELGLHYEIDFGHPIIGRQSFEGVLTDRMFATQLAGARTFGFLEDIEALRAAGAGRGGSLDNCIVLGPHDVLNADGLRYADEFVRHKALDAVGDLATVGHRLRGHFSAVRGGHTLTSRLIRKLLSRPDAFVLVDAGSRPRVAAARACSAA